MNIFQFKENYFFSKKENVQLFPKSTINVRCCLTSRCETLSLHGAHLFNIYLDEIPWQSIKGRSLELLFCVIV